MRGSRSALPAREALILLAILNHPWLIEAHAEEISELEFMHPGADLLRRAILEAGITHHDRDPATLRAFVTAGELGSVVARLEVAITHLSDWPAQAARRMCGRGGPTSSPCIARLGRHKELRDASALWGTSLAEKLCLAAGCSGRLSALEGKPQSKVLAPFRGPVRAALARP